jgi:Kef-type K+ transport system membrane component KefB
MSGTLSSVPLLAVHQELLLLLQLGLLLGLALALGALARRIGMPAVVGELIAGLVLGPSILGKAAPRALTWLLPAQASQMHLLDAVSQVAVMLLVGMIGAQLDLKTMVRRSSTVLRVSAGGLFVPLALGLGAGFLLPRSIWPAGVDRTTFAVFLGVTMCVSAIPVIAKTLADLHLLHRDVGQLILASAAVQDTAGWLLLSLVSALAVGALGPGAVLASLIRLLAFIAVAALAGPPLVRIVLRTAARAADPGPVNAAVAVLILLGAAAAQALRLEPVLGALAPGILIGAQPAAAPSRLGPLRVTVLAVFAPIFLATAGLRADLTQLRTPAMLGVGAVILVLAVLGKFAGAYAGARFSKLNHWEGLALGAGLNARGVVEIVIATVGLRLGVLSVASYTIVVLVAVLTSVMAPPFLRWAMARIEHTADERLTQADITSPAGLPPAQSRDQP